MTTSSPWWQQVRRWVVGVDGSPSAETALRWALAHASGRASSLQVVSAWQPPLYAPTVYGGPMAPPVEMDQLEQAATEEIERIAAEARHDVTIPVDGVAVRAGASTALLEASVHASLLVLGTRGRGGFSRLLLGSTSSQCAAHAEVPTVVVNEDWVGDTQREILVGLDGSPNSLTALDWALRFASPGTTVEVMWVWDTSPLAVGADEFFFPDAGETAELRFHHLVDQVVAQLDTSDVTVERTFWRGRPREDLAVAAEKADLVVVGARGHGAVGAALLGSVSSWLLHHVHRPLVVVPNADDGRERHGAATTPTAAENRGGAAA